MDEVARGLIRGPFSPEQLDAAYGVGGWRAMHGFGILQGGKIRPCDNAKNAGAIFKIVIPIEQSVSEERGAIDAS